ncbi:hypothetical protein IW142_000809 [Coemansia sp. RSA 564]|nr:hypothetical protein IW142_000809 [Coemansia sp. RSA 564]KAJ2267954.1 hypothetical protein GGH14_005907 [Coemansia sp. RSA 370]KAJ2408977.1 hypothetical protein J3F80_001663 [Coemansia sp. RSA 2526]KAJ2424154.1 hypothetical protein IWW41_004775 [Coemansia sp. RSA 2522]KAJ2840064.1 hypothetical protein J3B01_000164 [Coemansia erecta]
MLIAAAVVTGFSTGSVATLIASATAQLFGVERLSTVLGFVLVSEALGTCICVPVAGALLDAYDTYNGFTAIIWYGGAFYSAATVILVGLRLSVASVFRRV